MKIIFLALMFAGIGAIEESVKRMNTSRLKRFGICFAGCTVYQAGLYFVASLTIETAELGNLNNKWLFLAVAAISIVTAFASAWPEHMQNDGSIVYPEGTISAAERVNNARTKKNT